MKRKLISICLMIALISLSVFTLVACGANAGNVSDGNTEVATYQNLRVFNTGLKLTQKELLDRIKADYLKENKGYLDTDEIVVMVSLEGKSLIDDYIDEYSNDYSSVAEYAASEVGSNKRIYLQAQQEDAIRRLTQNGLIENVKCSYDTVMNGFAATIKYGNLRALENSSGVKSVIISDTYNRPQSTSSTGASSITNLVDVYETGIFNSSSVPYTGKKNVGCYTRQRFRLHSHGVSKKS